MKKFVKNSKEIENKTKKLDKNKVSLSELKHQSREISLLNQMGNSTKKLKGAFQTNEDTFFNAFLDGKLGKINDDMKPFLYDGYDRMNRKNYKKAVNGKISFFDGAKQAVQAIRKINGTLTRKSLVDILVRFYRFAEVSDERDTVDDLDIYSNKQGIYVPITNYLEKILFKLDNNFGKGMLTLHPIVRLLEISKYTKQINIDKYQHDPAIVPCNNVLFNRHNNKILKISPKYFVTHKLQANFPMGSRMDKIKNTKIKEVLDYNKGDDKVYHANPEILDETIPTFVHNFYNDLANGDKGKVIQLLQENLDALEPYFSHESLVINYGNTHTGKSNFMLPIRSIIGNSQYSSLGINQLDDKHAISTVDGTFAVLGDDLKNDIVIKDGTNLLKMVRGENIYTEKKYKQGVTSTYCQAIIQNTNSFPKTASKGDWINSRVLIVKFKHHFKKGDPDYLNDDLVKKILKNPLVDDYILYLTLEQPRFSRYLRTPESERLLRQFSNQNNPVQLFAEQIMQARKNRLVITPLYQQYKQYAKINNFDKISRTTFIERFKNCMPGCYTARERVNKQQVDNQFLITSQFHLKAHDFNNNGAIINTYINPIEPGHRYQCFIFPKIPTNIVDCDIDGTIFDILPDDTIKFPDIRHISGSEYDDCAKAFSDVQIFKTADNKHKITGIDLSRFIISYDNQGFTKTCRYYGLHGKRAHLIMDIMAKYMRIINKEDLDNKDSYTKSDSEYQDLIYRLRKENKEEFNSTKPFDKPQLPRLVNDDDNNGNGNDNGKQATKIGGNKND